VHIKQYSKVDHMKILQNSDAMKYIANVVTEEALLKGQHRQDKYNSLMNNLTVELGYLPDAVKPELSPSYEQGYRLAGWLNFTEISLMEEEAFKLLAKESQGETSIYNDMKLKQTLKREMKKRLENEHYYASVLDRLRAKQQKKDS